MEAPRLRAGRRYIDDPEIEEEPRLKKPRRKSNSGGGSSERRNRHSRKQTKDLESSRPAAEAAEISGVEEDAEAAQEKPQEMIYTTNTQTSSGKSAMETAAERRKYRHEIEEQQLKKLYAEIAEEIEEDEAAIYEEEKDFGSEENLDTLGLNAAAVDSDDDDDDDDSNSDEDATVEDSAEFDEVDNEDDKEEEEEDAKSSETTTNENSEQNADDEDTKERNVGNSEVRSSPNTDQATEPPQAETETPKREKAAQETTPMPDPEQQTRESEPAVASHLRRTRLLRSRLREDLSSEDGHSRHSGGRSSRRRRKNLRKRKKHRKSGPYRRMRFRHSRRELSEALEED